MQVAVHLDCYRKLGTPVGSWQCELCENTSLPSSSPKTETDGKDRCDVPQCGLCGRISGALRKSADGNWVHAFCAEVIDLTLMILALYFLVISLILLLLLYLTKKLYHLVVVGDKLQKRATKFGGWNGNILFYMYLFIHLRSFTCQSYS